MQPLVAKATLNDIYFHYLTEHAKKHSHYNRKEVEEQFFRCYQTSSASSSTTTTALTETTAHNWRPTEADYKEHDEKALATARVADTWAE